MKPIVNFHLHSTGSDGEFTPEEVVKKAIKAGLKIICFTDHYPLPERVTNWSRGFHSEEYYNDVKRVQKKYASKIKIMFGGEFDWVEGFGDYTKKAINKRKHDYILGSIHYLKKKDGKYFQVNNTWHDKIEEMLKQYSKEGFVKEFYRQLRMLIRSGMYDCVSHLDIVKCRNGDNFLFRKDEEWYLREIMHVLKEVKKAGMCIEINTGGLRVEWIKEQYPSKWILKEAFKLGIQITIGSDDHHAVDQGLSDAIKIAKEVGYRSINIFEGRKRKEIPI